MNKKCTIVSAALIIFSSLSPTALAANQITGEKQVNVAQKEVAPLQENLEMDSIKQRLDLLEKAITPHEAKSAIELWMKAVATRNGALQYALLSPDTRTGQYKNFTEAGWVTGASSPWVGKYQIEQEKTMNESHVMYTVRFDLATSTGYAGADRATVSLRKVDQAWYIEKIERNPNSTLGVWNTYQQFNTDTYTYKDQKFTVTLPLEWKEKIKVTKTKTETIFYYQPANKSIKPEFLFSIEVIRKSDWDKDGYMETGFYTLLGTEKDNVYALHTPGENPYANSMDSVEYKDALQMLQQLKKSIQFKFI